MNKKLKIILFVILIIIIIVLVFVRVSGYKKKVEYEGETIKIGVSLPLTYNEAEIGGIRLAEKEINEKGGILGKKIELIVKDDECNTEIGINKWNEFVNIDKPLAILGPHCSRVAEKVLPIAQNNKIPVILSGASAPDLTKIGNYIFSSYPSDILQGKFMADYIFTELNKNKVAIFYVDVLSGIAFKDIFIERFNRFKELGAEIVFVEGISHDEEEIKEKVKKIKDIDADVLCLFVSLEQGSIILKEMRRLGIDKFIVFSGDTFDQISPSQEFDNFLYSFPKVNNFDDFYNKVREIHKGEINHLSAYYYNSLNILAQAIERAGILNRTEIRNQLSKISYRGTLFPIVEFDEYGDLKEADFEVRIIKNGKVELYSK